MAVERKKFEELGFFPEQYAYNFGDVSACLNARRKGYRNICVCPTEMQHAESASRPASNSNEGLWLLRSESALLQKEYPEKDAYWNRSLKVALHPNALMISGMNFDLLNWDMQNEDMKRILLLNSLDQDQINALTWPDTKVIVGIAEHGRIMLARPGLSNAPAIELRDKGMITLLLRELGISKIVTENPNAETQYIEECLP